MTRVVSTRKLPEKSAQVEFERLGGSSIGGEGSANKCNEKYEGRRRGGSNRRFVVNDANVLMSSRGRDEVVKTESHHNAVVITWLRKGK